MLSCTTPRRLTGFILNMVWTFDPDAFYENILLAWQLTKKQEVFKGTKKFKSEKLGTHLQSDEGFCVVLVLLVSADTQ